jgi:hypothetical protein
MAHGHGVSRECLLGESLTNERLPSHACRRKSVFQCALPPQPICKKRLLNGDDMICKGNLYATASKVGKNVSWPLQAARISHNRRIIRELQKYAGEPEAATTCCRAHRERRIAHKTVQFVTKPRQ